MSNGVNSTVNTFVVIFRKKYQDFTISNDKNGSEKHINTVTLSDQGQINSENQTESGEKNSQNSQDFTILSDENISKNLFALLYLEIKIKKIEN